MRTRYRFTITTPDSDEIDCFPINGGIELTQQLQEDEDGSFFYRDGLGELRFNDKHSVYSTILSYEDVSTQCDEFTIKVEYNRSGAWEEIFNGIFTVSHCEFNMEKCTVSFKPEPDDIYRCLLKNYDVNRNILEIPDTVTIYEPLNRPTVFSDPYFEQLRETYFEFYVTDGTGGDEPYNNGELGYSASNSITLNFGGNDYEVFWRVLLDLECSGGSCVSSFTFVEGGQVYGATLLSSDCEGTGTCTYVIDDINGTGNVPTWDSFTTGDFSVDTDDETSDNNILIASEIYSGEYLFVNPVLDTGNEYSNGRLFSDVLEYLVTESCPDITSIRSNFFRINPTGASMVLTEVDKYKSLAIYQITDITYFDADDDATIGMMSLETLLTDLSVFGIRWRIEGTTFVIEHLADIEPSTTTDYSSLTGFKSYKYNREDVPKREVYSALSQRSIDFVGKDVEYTGTCAGDNKDEHNLQLFILDLPFVNSFPEDITTEGFMLLHFVEISSTKYVRLSTGGLSGNQIKNGSLGWANVIPELKSYRMFNAGVEVNGASFSPNSFRRIREAQLRFTNDGLLFDGSNLIQTELGTGIVDEVSTDLRTLRCGVSYRF